MAILVLPHSPSLQLEFQPSKGLRMLQAKPLLSASLRSWLLRLPPTTTTMNANDLGFRYIAPPPLSLFLGPLHRERE